MKEVDYIIVGQGIAGSALAANLIQQHKTLVVIDMDEENTSSKIAAGLCNPIVFKRLTKSWNLDLFYQEAKTFYLNQEKELAQKIFHPIPIYKVFSNKEEKDFWIKKTNDPNLFDWLNPVIETPFDSSIVNYNYGAAKVLNSFYVHTSVWINAFKTKLLATNSYVNECFDYENIKFVNNKVSYKNIICKKIIFCEGYKAINNPFFNYLPFKLTKGEVLTGTFKKLTSNSVINKNFFILPQEEEFKIGATYQWDNLDEKPTEQGKQTLITKINTLINDSFNCNSHLAGIRPTVKDRRPLVGIHPKYSALAIFNGLGTKGILMAPYLAKQFANYLIYGIELNLENVKICRFN